MTQRNSFLEKATIRYAKSVERIIDLSIGAAKKLDFYSKGLARVRVEAIQVKEK